MTPEDALDTFLTNYTNYTTSPAFMHAEGKEQWLEHFNYVHKLIMQLKQDTNK